MMKQIGYWVATMAFVLAMLLFATGELSQGPDTAQHSINGGELAYLFPILGVWKLLGIIALLVPGFPRLKEWAYAGFFFDLTGAAVLSITSGGALGPATSIALPSILTLIALASWALRPSSRTLGVLFARRQRA
jgi:hypothetical protein